MPLASLNYKAVFDKQLLIVFFAQQDKIFYLGRHLARKVIAIVKLIRIEILYQKRFRRRNDIAAVAFCLKPVFCRNGKLGYMQARERSQVQPFQQQM